MPPARNYDRVQQQYSQYVPKPSTVRKIALTLAVICLIIFSFLAYAVATNNDITLQDVRIVNWIADKANPTLTAFAFLITTIGSPLFITVAVLAGAIGSYLRFHAAKLAILFVSVGAGAALTMTILKLIFHRQRPIMAHPLDHEIGFSFPSGHATMSASVYGLCIFLIVTHVKRAWLRIVLAIALSVLVFAVALSRIYLGVHYPVDVAGGICLGTAWTCVSFVLYSKAIERINHSR